MTEILEFVRETGEVFLGFVLGSLFLVFATTVQVKSRRKKQLKKLEDFEKRHGITQGDKSRIKVSVEDAISKMFADDE